MSTYGTLTDYQTGESLRPATAAEWRRTADAVNDNLSPGSYTGGFDLDGRTVYVAGGPEAEVSAHDVRALMAEAASAGDTAQARECEIALLDDGSQQAIEAFQACAKVILDFRQED
jgi:hypothetical protein